MFRGVNKVNLDVKQRLVIPAQYRESINEVCEGQLICTIDTNERCLLLYPLPEWETIERKIESLPSFNQAARRIQRLLIGHATDLNMDKQGRVLLTDPLCEYAQIQKQHKVVLIGQGKKFEIWDEAHWNKQRDSWLAMEEAQGEDMPEQLQSLSL